MKLTAFLLASCAIALAAGGGTPELRRNGEAMQLLVDGQPFLILGGELRNSSASSLEFMEPIWPRLKAMSLNTVLATVSWELLEPHEGSFDFRLVDGLLGQARRNHLRLVLLWFGSWKNGVSSYAPLWVKTDLKRFPRARNTHGNNLDILTPFSENTRIADAKAFAALMKHLREIDSAQHTVLMMQVENEVGIRPEARDHSPEAEAAWKPGDSEEEFMARQYGRYIGSVAEAGKREYPLPMYVNAWLVQNERQRPGDYPSGGPVSKVMNVWRAAAGPSIDVFAPDIYLPDFAGVCALYAQADNPLFIPEASRGPESAANVFYAIGHHNAIGFSPFAIDGFAADHPIASAYALLGSMAPLILRAQAGGTIAGFTQGKEEIDRADIADTHFEVRYPSRKGVKGGGLIFAAGPEEFYIAGTAISVRFSSRDNALTARIGAVDEGRFVNGAWKAGRRLNGDETGGGGEIRLSEDGYSIQRVRLYRHER
jgi:hypothetical protein